VLAYSLQIGLLVAVRERSCRRWCACARPARGWLYWQLLLAACLLLPWVRPWHQRGDRCERGSVSTVVTSVAVPAGAEHFHLPVRDLLLYLLAAGVLARLAWLGAGFWRLRRYRRRGWPLENAGVWAEVLLSAEVSSPVTFGWRRPVILLPERFPQLREPIREAILCHENLHVERRDWLFTVGEEVVRAALWFHPAIWWLLAEIQLAREQAVDARAVEITESRDPYVDALLEMAGARPEPDLAPAPLFLRKRHLKQRVVEIVREATMSKTRWISALAASVVFLAGACWLVSGAFPLEAAPQVVTDAKPDAAGGIGAGVGSGVGAGSAAESSIDTDLRTLKELYARHPSPFMNRVIKRVVVSGLSERAKADLLARLPVHAGDVLTQDGMIEVHLAIAKFDMKLVFSIFPEGDQIVMQIGPQESLELGPRPDIRNPGLQPGTQVEMAGGAAPSVLRSITVSGISDAAKADLLARLPVHVGDRLPADASGVMKKIHEVVAAVDPRLRVATLVGNGRTEVTITVPGSTGQVNLVANGQVLNLISSPKPDYPSMAKFASVFGTVRLAATVGKDGRVRDLKVISGHPMLVQAALDAVGKWVYSPPVVNGQPAEVSTEINIDFSLPPSGNAEVQRQAEGSARVNIHNDPPWSQAPTDLPPAFSENGARPPRLISSVPPEFPQAAKEAHVQGTVVLSATVDKSGTVRDVKAVSGHPLLVQAAIDAVKQWVYQPALVNGEPAEARTTVKLSVALASSENAQAPRRIRVGGNVQQANVISQVSPHYPAEAKQAGLQGTVKLQALIGKEGTVQDLQVLSGEPVLAESALDALRQWVYKPTLINGQPVEVQTVIDVNFTLQ
jgi:TonB family protein